MTQLWFEISPYLCTRNHDYYYKLQIRIDYFHLFQSNLLTNIIIHRFYNLMIYTMYLQFCTMKLISVRIFHMRPIGNMFSF